MTQLNMTDRQWALLDALDKYDGSAMYIPLIVNRLRQAHIVSTDRGAANTANSLVNRGFAESIGHRTRVGVGYRITDTGRKVVAEHFGREVRT